MAPTKRAAPKSPVRASKAVKRSGSSNVVDVVDPFEMTCSEVFALLDNDAALTDEAKTMLLM